MKYGGIQNGIRATDEDELTDAKTNEGRGIMEKYFEINKEGHNIRCKLYFRDREPIEKVVLFNHGFAGHKDNGAAEKFAGRVLSKYKGIAVLIFNLPCHGDDVKKKIVLQDCMSYIDIALDYIRTEMHVEEIYSNATSFGGYLVLKYIEEYGNPFRKISLRCPAVNMAEVLTGTIMTGDDLEVINRGRTVEVGFDRKVEVNRQFLEDLEKSDVQKIDYTYLADKMQIIHGTADEVVPFEAGRRFAENNNIKFIPVEGADHRFLNPGGMETAIKKMLEFLAF